MYFRVDPASPVPLYSQLIEQIRLAIVSGVIQPGDRLPGIRELAEREAINPMTVVRASNALIQEGLLIGRRGQGTFVSDRNQKEISKRQKQQIARRSAEEFVARALQLGLTRDELLRIVSGVFSELEAGRNPSRRRR
jgi:GntR family transcriptional regulator